MKLKVIKGKNTYNIECSPDKTILENLISNNIKISAPCNGHGTCGKCKISLLKGHMKFKNNNINRNGLEKDEYLACQSYAASDCSIKLSQIESQQFSILNDFKYSKIQMNPQFKRVNVKVDDDFLSGKSLTDVINMKLDSEFKFTLAALRKLSTLINESSKKQSDYSIYKNSEIYMICSENLVLDIFGSESDSCIYGIAVDIGTTTIAMSLININTGKNLYSTSILNSQRQFGADVVSRIQYSMENDLDEISRCVKEDIIEGTEKLLDMSKLRRQNIYYMTISANNVMQHLLMGLFCDSMSYYPFITITNNIVEMEFSELFRNRLLKSRVAILPSISAYIGSDIVGGLSVCNFHNSDKICMFIDIGTNGEMALGNKDKILCISTAAGPAFEGANIENGVGSVRGAICSVKINKSFKSGKNDYKIQYSTIGDAPALGICGSGIIDMTAEMLKNEIIDKTGKFNENNCKNNFIEITESGSNTSKIVFTQKDVREIQMAKSAIRSGMEVLVRKFNCRYDDIDKVYIAGGFGRRINMKNAALIGLVPYEILDKIELVGNSSLSGAVEYLLDKNTKRNMQHIIDIADTVNISMGDEFNKEFINNMSF